MSTTSTPVSSNSIVRHTWRTRRIDVLPAARNRLSVGYIVLTAIIMALCACNLLFPVERSLIFIRLSGLPFRVAFIVTGMALAVIAVMYYDHLRNALLSRHSMWQMCFAGVLLMAAMRSESPVSGLGLMIGYLSAFVMNYGVLLFLVRVGMRRVLIHTICVCAGLAAVVGIVEGLTMYRLPFYDTTFVAYGLDFEALDMVSAYRVLGTLGNPIVYSTALMLALPFAADLKPKYLRWTLCTLLVAAGMLTLSRTVMLMVIPLLVGVLVIHWNARSIAGFAICGVLACMAYISAPTMLTGNILYDRWQARMSDSVSEQSTDYRLRVLEEIMGADTDMFSIFFGHGLRSESGITQEVNRYTNTIDNTYANIYYETGLTGLLAYLGVYIGFLYRTRRQARSSLHWYSLVGLMAAGMSFVTIYYYTFNFVAVASMAILACSDRRKRRVRHRSESRSSLPRQESPSPAA